jgi:hypothetical protein
MAGIGALLPYRSEREGQQKMGYDAFAEPTANDPNLPNPATCSTVAR